MNDAKRIGKALAKMVSPEVTDALPESEVALRVDWILAKVHEAEMAWQATESWRRVFEEVIEFRADMIWIAEHKHSIQRLPATQPR